jgi:hypothetical protein
MITVVVDNIRKYRAVILDIFLSAFGCFVLRRCFRLVAGGRDDPGTNALICTVDKARDPLAVMGAALILLAFAANEQPALMRARHI